jgi:hypothetical protein
MKIICILNHWPVVLNRSGVLCLHERARRLIQIQFMVLCMVFLGGCEPTNQGYEPEQPIPFSHLIHANKLKIDCQYCHFNADRGRYAGIPPLSTCRGCHQEVFRDSPVIQKLQKAYAAKQPIEWVRVHQLPDHAYFNHSPHVNAGVACQTCHGPVQEMEVLRQWAPLSMGWCVDCHRQTGDQLDSKIQTDLMTNCSTCHH